MKLLPVAFGAVVLGLLFFIASELRGIRESLPHPAVPTSSEIARRVAAEMAPFAFRSAGSSGGESASFTVLSWTVSDCPNVYPQPGVVAEIKDAGNTNGLSRYDLTFKSAVGSWPSSLVFSLVYERPGGGRAAKSYQIVHHPDWKPEDAFTVQEK